MRKNMGKRHKITVVFGLAVVSLAVILAGNLLKQPKMRLLMAGKHLIEQTSKEPDFLLYGLDLQQMVQCYVNRNTRSTGQIRVSGIKGLDKITLAFNYDARRLVFQQKAAANVELQVLRFPLGSLKAYMDGQRLYLTAPEYMEEPIAIDTGMALFQTMPEPAESVNQDWVKEHRKELLELLQETKVVETGKFPQSLNAETESLRMIVPAQAVNRIAALMELPLMEDAPELVVDIDLQPGNVISRIALEVPEEFWPGAKNVVSLQGEHLQLLEWKQESEQADKTFLLQRQEKTDAQLTLLGDINWKQGKSVERQYTVSGSINWEQTQDLYIELDDVVIEQDGEKLIKIDGDMKLIPWEGGIDIPQGDLTRGEVWDIAELIKDFNNMADDTAKLFQSLQGIQ